MAGRQIRNTRLVMKVLSAFMSYRGSSDPSLQAADLGCLNNGLVSKALTNESSAEVIDRRRIRAVGMRAVVPGSSVSRETRDWSRGYYVGESSLHTPGLSSSVSLALSLLDS